MTEINRKQPDFLPKVKYGRAADLKVHLISDEELTRLGQGSGQSLFLNFGIAVISIAVTFLVALLITKIDSIKIFCVFVIITILGFISGIVLLILWWLTRQPVGKLAKQIRDRMPPEGEGQPFPIYSETIGDVPPGRDASTNSDTISK